MQGDQPGTSAVLPNKALQRTCPLRGHAAELGRWGVKSLVFATMHVKQQAQRTQIFNELRATFAAQMQSRGDMTPTFALSYFRAS